MEIYQANFNKNTVWSMDQIYKDHTLASPAMNVHLSLESVHLWKVFFSAMESVITGNQNKLNFETDLQTPSSEYI